MPARKSSGPDAVAARAASPAAGRGGALRALLEPVVTAAGYDLEDISVSAAGRRSLVRVVLDSDTGIDLDEVAAIARAISDILDIDGDAILPGAYVLEVGSPGVDRRLTEARHWRRAVGRLVSTSLDGVPLHGRISSVEAETVTVDVDGAAVRAPLRQLTPGRVEVEFARPGQAEAWPEDPTDTDDDGGDEHEMSGGQPRYGEV